MLIIEKRFLAIKVFLNIQKLSNKFNLDIHQKKGEENTHKSRIEHLKAILLEEQQKLVKSSFIDIR